MVRNGNGPLRGRSQPYEQSKTGAKMCNIVKIPNSSNLVVSDGLDLRRGPQTKVSSEVEVPGG